MLLALRVRYSLKPFIEYDFGNKLLVVSVPISWWADEVKSERSKRANGLTLLGPNFDLCSSLLLLILLLLAAVTLVPLDPSRLGSVNKAGFVAALQLNDLEICLDAELDWGRRYFSKIRSTRD